MAGLVGAAMLLERWLTPSAPACQGPGSQEHRFQMPLCMCPYPRGHSCSSGWGRILDIMTWHISIAFILLVVFHHLMVAANQRRSFRQFYFAALIVVLGFLTSGLATHRSLSPSIRVSAGQLIPSHPVSTSLLPISSWVRLLTSSWFARSHIVVPARLWSSPTPICFFHSRQFIVYCHFRSSHIQVHQYWWGWALAHFMCFETKASLAAQVTRS